MKFNNLLFNKTFLVRNNYFQNDINKYQIKLQLSFNLYWRISMLIIDYAIYRGLTITGRQ